MSDWIVTKELDVETGEMIEILTARPGSKAEDFVRMLEEIKATNRYKPWVRRTERKSV